MQYGCVLLILLIVAHVEDVLTLLCAKAPPIRASLSRFANPVNADGSHYHGRVTEDEAFMWFDEATLKVRAGSGGAGSNTYRYGKSRQHLGKRALLNPLFAVTHSSMCTV